MNGIAIGGHGVEVVQIVNGGAESYRHQHVRDGIIDAAVLTLFLSFPAQRRLQRPAVVLAGATILLLAALDFLPGFMR